MQEERQNACVNIADKREPSVRTLDIATDFRASAQLQRSRAGGALGDSLILRVLPLM
jgi:hypothetical protein